MAYVVDTCAWIEYFYENKRYRERIERGLLKTPMIVISELSRVLIRKGISDEARNRLLSFVRKRSILMELDYERAILAGEISANECLPLSDSIVYSYASDSDHVLTGDSHFKGKQFVDFVK